MGEREGGREGDCGSGRENRHRHFRLSLHWLFSVEQKQVVPQATVQLWAERERKKMQPNGQQAHVDRIFGRMKSQGCLFFLRKKPDALERREHSHSGQAAAFGPPEEACSVSKKHKKTKKPSGGN